MLSMGEVHRSHYQHPAITPRSSLSFFVLMSLRASMLAPPYPRVALRCHVVHLTPHLPPFLGGNLGAPPGAIT